MRPARPEPPDDFYYWVGRVTLAFTQAELQLGMCGWTTINQQRWTEDWTQVTGRPGVALELCRKAEPILPAELSARLTKLIKESKRLRQQRNELNHSALIFDPTTAHESHPWLTRDAKGVEGALLTPDRGAKLVSDLNELARQASDLRAAIFTHITTVSAANQR